MFKKTVKLFSLFMLLLLSFIYTNKVFKIAKGNDPIMKKIVKYKKSHDVKEIEPIINNGEMIIGIAGKIVDSNNTYNKMKKANVFEENKIIYKKQKPKISVNNNFDYYVTKGNRLNKSVAIIFLVKEEDDIKNLVDLVAKKNVKINFFVDGKWIKKNTNTAFLLNSFNCKLYNMGYDNKYSKRLISITNNLIESITVSPSNYCFNKNKDEELKKLCKKKKMTSLYPLILDQSIMDIRKSLSNGLMIFYNYDSYDLDTFNYLISMIKSNGYNINTIDKVLEE